MRPRGLSLGEKAGLGDIQLSGTSYGPGSTAHVELAEDAVDVPLDRAGCDDQALADLRIGVTGDDEPKHLQFALAERLNEC